MSVIVRKIERRAIRHEELREKLRARMYLYLLERLAAKATKAKADKIPGFRLKADIYLRLLNKVLPDLKAIEHSERDARDIGELETQELRRRISALEGALTPQRGESESPEVH